MNQVYFHLILEQYSVSLGVQQVTCLQPRTTIVWRSEVQRKLLVVEVHLLRRKLGPVLDYKLEDGLLQLIVLFRQVDFVYGVQFKNASRDQKKTSPIKHRRRRVLISRTSVSMST